MAGTRRQSRVCHTTNTHQHQHQHQHQRSVSQAAPIIQETAIAAESKVIEIAESVDEGSSRPDTPLNRSTTAFCTNCYSNIGEFYNSWHKVTSTYYSPALLGSYRSLLRSTDVRKEASSKTELAGSIIHLNCCPNCDDCLGFVVVDAPADGQRFRGREFFELEHIELRCKLSPKTIIAVKPQEEIAPDLVAFEGSASLSPGLNDTAIEMMDIDSPLSSSHPLWTRPVHDKPQQQQQQLLPKQALGLTPELNGTPPSLATSRTLPEQGVPTSSTTPAANHTSMSPRPAQSRLGGTGATSVKDVPRSSSTNGQMEKFSYPRPPPEVYFDAIERLQTQTSQNTSALAAQARSQMDYAESVRQMESNLRQEFQSQLHRQGQDLHRMQDLVAQMRQEQQDVRQHLVGLTHELKAARDANARRPSGMPLPGEQDATLEHFAQRLGEITHRTSNLESLKDHVEIMNRKIYRLESHSAAALNPHAPPAPLTHPPAHPAQIVHAGPSHPSQIPQAPQAPQFQTPARPTSGSELTSHHAIPVAPGPPESVQQHESAPTQNGWATVNAGVKRVFTNDTDSSHQGASSAAVSPKRPKLATEGSQDAHFKPQSPPRPSHVLPSQLQPVVDSQPQPQSQPSQAYPSYGTPDGPSDDSWRPEIQRVIDSRPARGRGSRGGRGPGSRGGRVRKSMQAHEHPLGTPEWERDSWPGVSNSQASPDGFEDHAAYPARSIMRRGGGGSGMRGGYSPMERSHEWAPQIGPRSMEFDSPSDEKKKSRSKPVRNSEGILIRKDGRPDMRSQSSAANLRKVHARKEEQQREGESESTPTGLRQSISAAPETPSPTSYGHPDVTNSIQKRHKNILGRMFPDGLDTSRKQHDYAHQVFNEERDHTTQVLGSGYSSSRTFRTPHQIKREQLERYEVAETQAASSTGDVDMQTAEDHTITSTPAQTPGRDHAHSPEADHHDTQHQATLAQEELNTAKVPETQSSKSSTTLTAESVEREAR